MKSFLTDTSVTEVSIGSLNEENDKVLAASASNNTKAFETLYERHRPRVYSLCLRMLQNTHEAEDLTQDVFIQLHRKIHTFAGKSEFTTWLHRMTVNQVLMHFRKRVVKKETTEKGEEWIKFKIDASKRFNMPLIEKISLDKAISQLPEGYRNVFVLHDVEGYEHSEVAKILGCSLGTSKSQLHKARLKMRKLINEKANPKLVW